MRREPCRVVVVDRDQVAAVHAIVQCLSALLPLVTHGCGTTRPHGVRSNPSVSGDRYQSIPGLYPWFLRRKRGQRSSYLRVGGIG